MGNKCFSEVHKSKGQWVRETHWEICSAPCSNVAEEIQLWSKKYIYIPAFSVFIYSFFFSSSEIWSHQDLFTSTGICMCSILSSDAVFSTFSKRYAVKWISWCVSFYSNSISFGGAFFFLAFLKIMLHYVLVCNCYLGLIAIIKLKLHCCTLSVICKPK